MKIRLGKTRLVILIENKAYKIARIRPIRFILRMIINPFSKKRRDHFHKKFGDNFSEYFFKDVFAGLYANIGEYRYYKFYRDPRIIPTHKKYLGGLVIVQDVGQEINQQKLVEINPLHLKSFTDKNLPIEITEAKQYGLLNGNIVLLDYGEPLTRKILSRRFMQNPSQT